MSYKKTSLTSAAAALFMAGMVLSACNSETGYEFMPDMYRSPSVETYSTNPVYADGMSARKPAANTIPRGYVPYSIPNTPEGYELAGQTIKSPLTVDGATEEQGKILYAKYCVHCHGEKGDGAGTIKVKGDPFPVPSYTSDGIKSIPDGKMFHTITYGKGLMGPHASQLNQTERWKLVAYVNKLQRDGGVLDGPAPAAADSTKKGKK